MGRLSNKQKGKLGAHAQHGTEISAKELEAMADELLKGTPEVYSVKSPHQMRHAARKERPRGANPGASGRVMRQVG